MFRKIYRKINKATNSNLYIFIRFMIRIIVVPLTYSLWILEPFIKIRIYRGEIGRIGHLATYYEVLIRSKEVDLENKRQFNVFIVPNNPANKTLYNMWKKHLNFVESNKLDFIFHLCAPWLAKNRHFGPLKVLQGGLPIKDSTIKFNCKENTKGINLAKEMGITADDWFVCLHSRSSVYLKKRFSNKDYSYHDIRDSKFEMLEESANLINRRGGKCVRMSNGDNQKLNTKMSKYIIDYAHRKQNDFMDVYLPANCKFFLGGPSGLISVSHLFNVPVACTNIWPITISSLQANCLFIPKLMWLKEDKRFLNYKEINDAKLGVYRYNKNNPLKGIEIIENDNDDIKLLTEDMLDLINNVNLSVKDENIRDNFMNKYFTVNKFTNKYNRNEGLKDSGKISWRFLNKHSYLMDK